MPRLFVVPRASTSSARPRRGPRALVLLLMLGAMLGIAEPVAAASLSVQLFDANMRYTAGFFLPLSTRYSATSVRPFTSDTWPLVARPLNRVTADGVTLVLVRAQLPRTAPRTASFTLWSEQAGADPGSLWAVDDQRVIDRSPEGGAIDGAAPLARTLQVQTVVINGRRYAFLLYRAPRDFDGASRSTGQLSSRTAQLVLRASGALRPVASLTIVRPLVVFVHGTTADNDAWVAFPLWQNSANELHEVQPQPSTLPFATDRISFSWIWNATGGLIENAATILPQLVAAIRSWREATGTAATQADVVTHSFGGLIARQVVQSQPDPDPLAPQSLHNFRAAANWGHGSIHKLITLAATHRGAATANATAFVNQHGRQDVGGTGFNLRGLACAIGEYIDRGAVRDQMVLSRALVSLAATPVPGHALAGSGRAILDPSHAYALQASALARFFDLPGGPYATAFSDLDCPYDTLANYIFNLDPHVPPVTGSGSQCQVTPDYDLVVSVHSSQGLMPPTATTTVADLATLSGLDLIGRLNHSALRDPTFGSPAIVNAVSDRVVFLLQQATTSGFFGHFPAVASVAPTPLEERFTREFDPAWLEVGPSCPPPQYPASCPQYTAVKVIPGQLVLEDSTPTPLYVYGQLGGQWVLAYSPSALAPDPATNRNCRVTLTSSDPSIVDLFTNSVTNAQVAVATGIGTAAIEVSVQNVRGTVPVPVTVEGLTAVGPSSAADRGLGRRWPGLAESAIDP